jgi:Cof subfamily protein (haloacid dehalogenase superfamily)
MNILFSDYDGTFFTDETQIKKNVAAVNTLRQAGHKFALATGRSLASAKRVISEHNISYDYLILNNGALITDNQDNLLLKQTLSPELSQQVIDFAKANAEIDEDIYYYGLGDKTTTPEPDITKIRINTPGKSHASAEQLSLKLNKHFANAIKSHPAFTDLYPEINCQIVDITNKNADKSTAINFILDREHLPPSSAITVGDGPNDLEMLVPPYTGFAMSSSDPSVLDQVKSTIPSVADLIADMLK